VRRVTIPPFMSEPTPSTRNPLKRIYNWVLSWAESPWGATALFVISFCESSFFPIPPDVLLIALCIGARTRAWRLALICSLGSVAGGAFGYALGYFLFEPVCWPIIEALHMQKKFIQIRALFHRYDIWAVGAAGFSPIPYKVFTIFAGFAEIDLWRFLAASAVSRSARFFLVAGLIRLFGERIETFLDKYFNLCALAFTVLLVGAFFALGLAGKHAQGKGSLEPAVIEPLLSQLESPDSQVRRKAALELGNATGHFVGFNYKAAKEDRDKSVQRWRDWWAKQQKP